MKYEGRNFSTPLAELSGTHAGSERINDSIEALMKTVVIVRSLATALAQGVEESPELALPDLLAVLSVRGGNGIRAVISAIIDHQSSMMALDIKGENFAMRPY